MPAPAAGAPLVALGRSFGVDTAPHSPHSFAAMLDSLKPRGGKRWPRGQKFSLSPAGTAAEAAYRDVVHACRAQGRVALENGERAWSAPLGIELGDGVTLGELRSGRKSIAEIARALEGCGTTPAEVKASIDRLADAGLVEPALAAAA